MTIEVIKLLKGEHNCTSLLKKIQQNNSARSTHLRVNLMELNNRTHFSDYLVFN